MQQVRVSVGPYNCINAVCVCMCLSVCAIYTHTHMPPPPHIVAPLFAYLCQSKGPIKGRRIAILGATEGLCASLFTVLYLGVHKSAGPGPRPQLACTRDKTR